MTIESIDQIAVAAAFTTPQEARPGLFLHAPPRTPHNNPRGQKQPAREFSASIFQKVRGDRLAKPVDRRRAARKSLMLERNRSTAFYFSPRISSILPPIPLFAPHATLPSHLCKYLSILLKKKKKKRGCDGNIRILLSTEIYICLKNSPRVFSVDAGEPVEIPFSKQSLASASTHPRVFDGFPPSLSHFSRINEVRSR